MHEKEIEQRNKWYEEQMKSLRENPMPYMSEEDIALFTKELFEGIDVLEWGSGGSTIYFPMLIKDCTWETIEYDIVWYVELLKLELENVRLHLFDEDILRYDDRRTLVNKPMTEYIKFPARFGKKYDLIFIDGAKRVECLKEAVNLLKENGVVLVHDAQRPEYKKGFDLFDGEFLSKTLWKGKKKSQ